MKEPIEPSEIRAGDLIRVENRASSGRDETAHEFRASIDKDNDGWVKDRFNWFLLDRPKPAVVLPTKLTLGWLTYHDGAKITDLSTWCKRGDGVFSDGGRVPVALVTAFTPATAVPTEALEKLRAAHGHELVTADDLVRFFAAVDAASEATS